MKNGLWHYSRGCLSDRLCTVCRTQPFFRASLRENYLGVTSEFVAGGACPWGRYLSAGGKVLKPNRSLKLKFWRYARTRRMAEWMREFGLHDLAEEALTDPLVRKVIDQEDYSRNDRLQTI